MVRFTAYDVREKVSQTAVPLGFAEISLGVIQDTARLRIPICCQTNNVGFITIVTFTPEQGQKIRSPLKKNERNQGHRRSQSLPPKLGVKLFIPPHSKLNLIFTNPHVSTPYSSTQSFNVIFQYLQIFISVSVVDKNISLTFWTCRWRHQRS
jgi:inositol polyphosphate-4-phosphatase